MLFNLFKKRSAARAIESEARKKLNAIKKISDPAERLTALQSYKNGLQNMYDGGKPVLGSISRSFYSPSRILQGAGFGLLATFAAGGAIMLLGGGGFLLAAGIWMGTGTLIGAAAGAGAFSGSLSMLARNLKRIRRSQGSLRHARKIYRLTQQADKAILYASQSKMFNNAIAPKKATDTLQPVAAQTLSAPTL